MNIYKTGFYIIAFVLTINLNNSYSIPRNVLIEYVTGTWCGNCPCGHQTLNTINLQYPQTIVLAYHAFNNDPWKNFNGNEIVSLLNIAATPTAVIDRYYTASNSNYSQWITGVQNRYNSAPDSKINIAVVSKTFNENTRELTMTISATALEDLFGQYKINFVILENNLIYEQNFYSQCGTPGIVQNYVHNHVVRNMINTASGEELNQGNIWNSNQMISKSINTIISNNWNAENCKVVIFAYKVNSPLASANIEQAIETGVTGTVGIQGNGQEIASGYSLSQNYPNPFNPSTNIKFTIPESKKVSLKVFDLNGKEVDVYVNGFLQKGSYNIEFDGSNLSSGIYFYVLKTDIFTDKKKMILVK